MRLDIDQVQLKSGGHGSPKEGLCVMEAVAYIAREKHSDNPECVSPVIGAFMRAWNDVLSDEDRQKLKALIPVIMDTRSTPEDEERRAWMALDWVVREHTPAWLRLAGLIEQAERLEGLPRFRKGMDVPAIRLTLEAVRSDADAAWAAAGAAAGAAAWDAAGDALRPTVEQLQDSALHLVERMAWLKDDDD